MTWSQVQKENWYREQSIQRSFRAEVVGRIEALRTQFDVSQYGALSVSPELYPLYILNSRKVDHKKKTILITGGVHGYETSGVHGALGFLERVSPEYLGQFNFFCAPCVSPWSYETINRWNSKAIDPNRSFYQNSPAEECAFFLRAISAARIKPYAHFDLHETTDTDNKVFRPALEQRDGVTHEFSEIPDGFYLVGDSENPQREFQKSIIDAVSKITHIAPPDRSGKIIGAKVEQEGVINYPLKKLFLCAGVTQAKYTTTTEVYPDSPKVTSAICIDAQIAAIAGGLDYLRRESLMR